jgi:phospholipid transport system substrate-binding protein
MYFDYLTLAGLFSAIGLAGILYGMASKDISKGRVPIEKVRPLVGPELDKMRPLCLMTLVLLLIGTAVAGPAPEQLIRGQADSLLHRLSVLQTSDRNPDALEALVTEIIAPHVDFTLLSRLVLGKYWRRISTEEQERFEKGFKRLVVKTYASALSDTSNLQISYLAVREDSRPGRVEVPTRISSPNNPPINVAYRLYKKGDVWRVYDVTIEGVSMALNYRSVLAERIKRHGVERVVDNLLKAADTLAINRQ